MPYTFRVVMVGFFYVLEGFPDDKVAPLVETNGPAVLYSAVREQSDNDFLTNTPPQQWPRFLVIRDDVWQRTPAEVKEQLEIVGSARGTAYAAGGKTWTVWVVRKKSS